MSRTRWPISASAAPRLTAVVVLPTPPFCMATAIVRAKSAPSLTEARRDRPHPIIGRGVRDSTHSSRGRRCLRGGRGLAVPHPPEDVSGGLGAGPGHVRGGGRIRDGRTADRKSTRLNSSHEWISYAVFCLKK